MNIAHRIYRPRARRPIRPALGVEFLDDGVAPQHAVESDRLPGWAIRVTIAVLIATTAAVWVVARGSETGPTVGASPVAAPPGDAPSAPAHPPTIPDLSYVLAADVPTPVARTMSRALPGIAIRDVTRAGGRTRSIDARYEHLSVAVDITPGGPPAGTTVQTVTSGASDVTLVHNRRPAALRTITVTVVAPHRAHLPIARLQQMVDRLGRLSRLD
jgi:hypothetical protein